MSARRGNVEEERRRKGTYLGAQVPEELGNPMSPEVTGDTSRKAIQYLVQQENMNDMEHGPRCEMGRAADGR